MCFYLSLIRRGEIHPSTPQSVVNNITHFPLKKDIFVSVIKPWCPSFSQRHFVMNSHLQSISEYFAQGGVI